MSIILNSSRLQNRHWVHTPIRKLFTELIDPVRSRVISSDFYTIGLPFETSGVASSWMQVQCTYTLASHFFPGGYVPFFILSMLPTNNVHATTAQNILLNNGRLYANTWALTIFKIVKKLGCKWPLVPLLNLLMGQSAEYFLCSCFNPYWTGLWIQHGCHWNLCGHSSCLSPVLYLPSCLVSYCVRKMLFIFVMLLFFSIGFIFPVPF